MKKLMIGARIGIIVCALGMIAKALGLRKGRIEPYIEFDSVTLLDKRTLELNLRNLQDGFVSISRMASRLMDAHDKERYLKARWRECDGCGKKYLYETHISKPPDRPPICCSIKCHSEAVNKQGRRCA